MKQNEKLQGFVSFERRDSSGFTIKPGDVSPVSAFMGYFSSEQEGTRESV